MRVYITIVPGGHEVDVLVHIDRKAAKDALGLTQPQIDEAVREGDYHDPDGGGSVYVQEIEFIDVLRHVLVDAEESWFNAIIDLVAQDRIQNSHDVYTRLLAGVAAVGESGGFPYDVFRQLVPRKLDEVHAEVTR